MGFESNHDEQLKGAYGTEVYILKPVAFSVMPELMHILLHSVAEHLLQFSLHGLLNFSLNPVLNNNFHSPLVYSHLAPNKVL